MRRPSSWIPPALTALLVGCGSSSAAPRPAEPSAPPPAERLSCCDCHLWAQTGDRGPDGGVLPRPKECEAIFATDPCGNKHCQAVQP